MPVTVYTLSNSVCWYLIGGQARRGPTTLDQDHHNITATVVRGEGVYYY